MIKPKIAFYGNCQISYISRIFNSTTEITDNFEILSAKDYGLLSQASDVSVAHFQLGKEVVDGKVIRVNNYSKSGLKNFLNDADILIFQSLDTPEKQPSDVQTKNIIPNFKGTSICIPSWYFTGYFSVGGIRFPHLPFFYWLRQENFSQTEAESFLRNKALPNTDKLADHLFQKSMNGLEDREREQSKLYNYISILRFVKNNYKRKLLGYNFHHPAETTYKYLCNKIFEQLNQTTSLFNFNKADPAGPDGECWFPLDIQSFNHCFPNMENLKRYKDKFNSSNSKKIGKSFEAFCKRGMDIADHHFKSGNFCNVSTKHLEIINGSVNP